MIKNIRKYIGLFGIIFLFSRKILLDMNTLDGRKLIVEQVADVVCGRYGIDINRVFGLDRHKPVADARNIIVYILHKDFGLSISFLSREFDRSERWIMQICATKKQHITMYADCEEEHEMFLDLLKK